MPRSKRNETSLKGVSIITAAFNAAGFLEECLDSVERQQTDQTLEHIVIDGGSTDNSVQILQRYSKVRWISEADHGQADAFNKGVRMATGDWICWLNADDALASGAISAFQRALAKNPAADMVYGHVQFVNEDSSPAWTCYHLPFFYPLILNGCYTPPSSGTFFRRDLLLREPLDTYYHYVMDVEWFLRCGRTLNAVLVNETLSRFRISPDAKTSGMIRSGKITNRHGIERENYRRKHVYSQWPKLAEEQARHRFERCQRIYRLLYFALKMRYAHRYLSARLSKP